MVKNCSTESTDLTRLLDEALSAESAGRHVIANELLNQAARGERALALATAPVRYWAEGAVLLVESADGAGPCPVLVLQTGSLDMSRLAELLNQSNLNLTPRSDLTPETRFEVDGEYVARDIPLTVLVGFDLGREVAAVLNSEAGIA